MNKLFKDHKYHDKSLGRETIAVIIARREVPGVPVGRVVRLATREWVDLQLRLNVITGRKMLHLAEGVIIHPVKYLVSGGSPCVHLTHPSPLMRLPISSTHVSVIIRRPNLIIPIMRLMGYTFLIILNTLRSSRNIPSKGPIPQLHHNTHLLEGLGPHHPTRPTVAQVPHNLRYKDPI